MTAALILKELRQHWLAFLLVAGLTGIGMLLLTVSTAIGGEAGSMLDVLHLFLRTFFVIAALVLCNRLVVREYQSKTQLFLQGLPVSRLHMILVKYLFGLLTLLVMVTVACAFVVLLSAPNEQLTVRFLLIIAARTYSYSWCVYSFFFMMGLLGRYRVAIYLFAIVGAAAVETLTKLELARFGPFALVNEQFAYERFDWPIQPLLVTLALATAFVALTFVLALVREGSVAAILAEKMSHREKVLMAALLLGFVFSLTVFDERIKKKPFDLPGALAARVGDVTVKVSLGALSDEKRGQRLAQTVADNVAELQEYLQIDELPPIFIVQRRDLDADVYERGVLEGAEGLLVRTNFLSDHWQSDRFLSWLVRELIILASDGRAKIEPRMWVLDGFAHYWICRDSESKPAEYAMLEMRAAYGMERGFEANDVATWLTYRERVGKDIATAVAWYGLVSLRRSQGDAACQAFLRAVLDCSVPGDVRGLWQEWRNPLPKVAIRETGLPYDELLARWSGDLEALRESRKKDLEQIPKLAGTLKFESITELTRIVNFEFTSEPPPSRFTLLHAELAPFDDEVPPSDVHRDELQYASERSGQLPGSYARGTRFYATFAVRVEQLGCEIISGWTRQEMR